MDIITITAVDMHSSDSMSRSFLTEKPEEFKKAIEEFEEELPYSRYELMSEALLEGDCSEEIEAILDELEIEF